MQQFSYVLLISLGALAVGRGEVTLGGLIAVLFFPPEFWPQFPRCKACDNTVVDSQGIHSRFGSALASAAG